MPRTFIAALAGLLLAIAALSPIERVSARGDVDQSQTPDGVGTVDISSEPENAAEAISQLETGGTLPQLVELYGYMHPDAQEIIPRYVVVGWYEEDFLPRGPEQAVATDVEYVDWTWPVNGVTYLDTAEVSYTQEFADGETVEDVVRLVEVDGEWRWFFGRSEEFVDEQIARFRDAIFPEQTDETPYGLEATRGSDADLLEALPATLGQGELDAEPTVESNAGPGSTFTERVTWSYTDEEFTVGYGRYTELNGVTSDEWIATEMEEIANSPNFAVLDWNTGWSTYPDPIVPFALYKVFANDAIGDVYVLVWGAGDSSVFEVSGRTLEEVELLAAALVEAA